MAIRSSHLSLDLRAYARWIRAFLIQNTTPSVDAPENSEASLSRCLVGYWVLLA